MMTIATHAASRSCDTSATSAAMISSLSAIGSMSLPNVVIALRRAREVAVHRVGRRREPEDDRREQVAVRRDSSSSATTSTGTSRIRSSVRTFGRFSSNTTPATRMRQHRRWRYAFSRFPERNIAALHADDAGREQPRSRASAIPTGTSLEPRKP